MRCKPGLHCYAPFGPDGSGIPDERLAFDFDGRVHGKLEKNGARLGDVVSVTSSLAWSDRAQSVLHGFRMAPTIRVRPLDLMLDGKLIAVFNWANDFGFGEYDVLNREQSEYKGVPGTKAVLNLQRAVVDEKNLPPFDIWGSMYSCEFFVTAAIKKSLADANCTGFTFRDVHVNH
jgi:hypothetical protein